MKFCVHLFLIANSSFYSKSRFFISLSSSASRKYIFNLIREHLCSGGGHILRAIKIVMPPSPLKPPFLKTSRLTMCGTWHDPRKVNGCSKFQKIVNFRKILKNRKKIVNQQKFLFCFIEEKIQKDCATIKSWKNALIPFI